MAYAESRHGPRTLGGAMSNNAVKKAAVLIGLSIAMSGVNDANAATACTGDEASKSSGSKVPAIILLSGITGDDCDVDATTQLLVTDFARSGSDTLSSVQFDPLSGTGAGANFLPNFPISGPLPQIVVVGTGGAAKPDSPVPSGIPFVSGSQDGQTTGGGKAGSQDGQTTGGGKAGSQDGQTTADGKAGSQGGQATADGKGGLQGDGSGKSDADPGLQDLTLVGDPAQAVTPLPAALPLFGSGLGALGLLLGWRRKRRAQAVA